MRDMTRFTRVNGSIAAVVVFLVWVYVQAVILLYGVEFTAAYARLRRGRPEEVPAAPRRELTRCRIVGQCRSSVGCSRTVIAATGTTVASARMIASLNTGTSSGLREVIRLPSSTTGLSTYSPPAFLTSMAIDGQQVSVRPRSALAEISTCGPWQIAATGLPALHRIARQVDHRVAHAHLVRRVAAGNDQRVEVLDLRRAGRDVRCARPPRRACRDTARRPTVRRA